MQTQKTPKRAGLRALDPFQWLEGEAQARGAARAGALVPLYIAMSYVVQLTTLAANGVDTYGNTGSWMLISHIGDVAFAAFLMWRILARQPLWAAIVAAAWYAFELTLKIAMVANGERQADAGIILMFVVIAAAAVVGIRGTLKLRQLRHSSGIAELFD